MQFSVSHFFSRRLGQYVQNLLGRVGINDHLAGVLTRLSGGKDIAAPG
ncbi:MULTISPECIES: hypothetical protein [Burkholderia]|nr:MULTISPECIES: hypothetical protein [Burkholderia]